MTRHRELRPAYEYLIGAALVDAELARSLLQDPRGTAVTFGLSSDEATLLADISAPNLRSFAATLLPRLYGEGETRVPQRRAAAG